MDKVIDKITELKDIYTPLGENLVIQFEIPGKTKAGVHLLGEAAKKHQQEQTPVMQVIAVGPDVKNVKIGEWILPYPNFRPNQVPLIYKNAKEGLQHAQIHVSEIMGIVDSIFATFKAENKTIN